MTLLDICCFVFVRGGGGGDTLRVLLQPRCGVGEVGFGGPPNLAELGIGSRLPVSTTDMEAGGARTSAEWLDFGSSIGDPSCSTTYGSVYAPIDTHTHTWA